MKTILKPTLLVLALVLIAGCAKVPQGALDSASLLIDDAKMQEADVFAPDLFMAAQDSFQAAQTELEAQHGKFALMRNYDVAERMLAGASEMARQATEAGIVRKQEMRTETENVLIQAKETAAEAKLLLAKAPRGKEGRIALVSIGSDIDSLGGQFVEVEELLAQGNVKSANEKVLSLLQRAESLRLELVQAIDKARPGSRG